LVQKFNLRGGHVIKLGPKNDTAAKEALTAWPQAFHIGGGVTMETSRYWIEAGAEKVSELEIELEH